jgi:WD40 repeat protein
MLRGTSRSVRIGIKGESWLPVAFDVEAGRVAAVSRRHVFVGTIAGDGLTMRRLPGEVYEQGGFSFLNHGLDLLGSSSDGKVLRWSLSRDGSEPVEAASGARARLVGSSPASNLLLVVLDRAIQLVDPATGGVLLESPISDVREFSFSPDGAKLAVTSGGYIVTVLDLDINRWVRELCAVANRNLSAEEWTSSLGTDVPSRLCSNAAGSPP